MESNATKFLEELSAAQDRYKSEHGGIMPHWSFNTIPAHKRPPENRARDIQRIAAGRLFEDVPAFLGPLEHDYLLFCQEKIQEYMAHSGQATGGNFRAATFKDRNAAIVARFLELQTERPKDKDTILYRKIARERDMTSAAVKKTIQRHRDAKKGQC